MLLQTWNGHFNFFFFFFVKDFLLLCMINIESTLVGFFSFFTDIYAYKILLVSEIIIYLQCCIILPIYS